MTEILIKRYRQNAYNEQNIYCHTNGQEICRESNVIKSIKYGTKQVEFKGKLINATWQRVYEL